MIFSSQIYRRPDFSINIYDEPDEHISVQEIEVSVPTCKRRISDDLSEEDSNSVSSWESRKKKSAYEKKQTKVKELTKMLKMMLLVPIRFFLVEGSKFWFNKFLIF